MRARPRPLRVIGRKFKSCSIWATRLMDHNACADPTAQIQPESLRPGADRLPGQPRAQTRLQESQHPPHGGTPRRSNRGAAPHGVSNLPWAGTCYDVKIFARSADFRASEPSRSTFPKMNFADDGVEALGCILRAVSTGAITPDEGAKLATIVRSYSDAIDMADVVKRIRRARGADTGSGTMRNLDSVKLLVCRN